MKIAKALMVIILSLWLTIKAGIGESPIIEFPTEIQEEIKLTPEEAIPEPPVIIVPIEPIIPSIEEPFTYDIHDVVCLAKLIQGEGGGLSLLERSAIVWCALNYLDSGKWEDNIIAVVKSPNRFTGYHDSNKVTDENIDLVIDILDRYNRELKGEKNVGRTLPKDYICFRGFKWPEKAQELGLTKVKYSHNWFFTAAEYRKGQWERKYWDWSLPNPYKNGLNK